MSDEWKSPDVLWHGLGFNKRILRTTDDPKVAEEWRGIFSTVIEYRRAPVASSPATGGDDKAMREALEWYEQQARDCRKITMEGDTARVALDKDGGARARAALEERPIRPAAQADAEDAARPNLIECSERIRDAIVKGSPLAKGIALGLSSLALSSQEPKT